MRIVYLLHLSVGSLTGIIRKVIGQIATWKALDTEVRLHLVTSDDKVTDGFRQSLEGSVVLPFTYPRGGGWAGWFGRVRAIRSALRSAADWGAHVVYTRQDFYYPVWHTLGPSAAVVIEINTDDLAELKVRGILAATLNRITRGRLLRRCSGMVFVDEELGRKPQFSGFGKPALVIGNGIDFRQVRWSPAPSREGTRLVFIGSGNHPWHGLDKVEHLAAVRPDWDFEIVGDYRASASRPNLKCRGHLEPADYEAILAGSDCALGTLALHRKASDFASPLKTREYLASGLPVIVGYRDADFRDGAEFLLPIGNHENNVSQNLPAIDEFVTRWKGRRVARSQVASLDVSVKERLRLDFLSLCAKRTRMRDASHPSNPGSSD